MRSTPRRFGRFPAMAAALAATVSVGALGTACAQGASKGTPKVPASQSGSAQPAKALYEVPTTEKVIALTYDDGPGVGAVGTPAILALLKANHAKATFFVLGEEVHQRPEVLKQTAQAGMEVENHGERHANMAHLGKAGLHRVIGDGARTIEKITGQKPVFLRPPFGAQNARVRTIANEHGERVVIWSVDTRDWTNPGAGTIVQRVLHQVKPGSIVLMHDGGSNRSQTVDATRELLPALAARGYKMVTLKELVKIGKSSPPAAPAGPTKKAASPTRAGSR